jgi:hypothetical protein
MVAWIIIARTLTRILAVSTEGSEVIKEQDFTFDQKLTERPLWALK